MNEDGAEITVVINPPWVSQPAPALDGSLLRIDHPEHGPLYFFIPPNDAEKLGSLLIKQAGIASDRHGLPTVGNA